MFRLDLLLLEITTLYQPICMGYCGNNIGISTCTGNAALQHQSTTCKMRSIIWQSKHLRCQAAEPNSVAPNRRSYRPDWWTLRCSVQPEDWPHLKSSLWCSKEDPWDNERWHVNSITSRGTFVRICGSLASRLVHKGTPIRWTISAEWRKRQSNIRFEQPEHSDWRSIYRNIVGLEFQTIVPCGLDQISCVF